MKTFLILLLSAITASAAVGVAPSGGGSAPTGTLVNTTATAAGNLVAFSDTTKTNTTVATTANIQATLGSVYQSTNSFLTTLAALGAPTETGSRLSLKPDGTFAWVTPRNYTEVIDEFMGNGSAVTGWKSSAGGGGSSGFWDTGFTGGNFGCSYLQAGTSAGGVCYLKLQDGFYFGQGRTFYETRVLMYQNASDATDTYEFVAGFMDSLATTNTTDGIFFKYLYNYNDSKWTAVTANNSSWTTNTAWSGTVAANTWYRLGIDVAGDGSSAVFYVDGTAIATNVTNIPNTAARVSPPQYYAYKHAGTNQRFILIDYCRIYQWLTSSR